MSEFNLIKFEGKALEKLIDVISKGIGTLYRPLAIRKEADAKAYKIDVVERAKSKAIAEGKEIEAENLDRIQERILKKELRRQNNIDAVSQFAAEQLVKDSSVSDEPVNDDWAARFFNIVEDITNEEMQRLWSRILAGEIKKPQSYSLRTLEVIKNISKLEADIFMNVANLAIRANGTNFIYKGGFDQLQKFNIKYADISLLVECGLLQPGDTTSFQYFTKKENVVNIFWTNSHIFHVNVKANNPFISIPIYVFTNAGGELLDLVKQNIPHEYIADFVKAFKIGDNLPRMNVEVKYCAGKLNGNILEYAQEDLIDFPIEGSL